MKQIKKIIGVNLGGWLVLEIHMQKMKHGLQEN